MTTKALIKRSAVTPAPANGSLSYGELAFSSNSNKLFFGDTSGNPVEIGGDGWIAEKGYVTLAATLDQFAAPAAAVSFNGQKLTNLADPTANTDAVNKQFVAANYLPLTGGTLSSDLVINGSLHVVGVTTSVDSTTVNIGTNILILNENEVGVPTQNAGFQVNRGSASSVSLLWMETVDYWSFGNQQVAGIASPTANDQAVNLGYANGAYIGQNIFTALGDLVYGGAANTPAKLSGNTTAVKQFLTQIGDGTNSAAPVWGSLVSADLPVVPVTKGGTGITSFTTGDILFGGVTANTLSALPIGTGNQVLIVDSATGVPTWSDPSSALPAYIDAGTF